MADLSAAPRDHCAAAAVSAALGRSAVRVPARPPQPLALRVRALLNASRPAVPAVTPPSASSPNSAASSAL